MSNYLKVLELEGHIFDVDEWSQLGLRGGGVIEEDQWWNGDGDDGIESCRNM